ncbi:oxygenase MpaB family protein [Marinoscillum pacificum]|uniref:oxygenase MpaB family protein n=1 Tax=Marinoscillum pacificum TaxID=392723 RepID=UPI0021587FD5|nr:oxygenase MpaB family protein [Marinoscillum pacificum]
MSDKHPRRHQGDPVGDKLFLLFKSDQGLLQQFRDLKTNTELSTFISANSSVYELLENFCQTESHDNKRINNGAIFFEKNVSVILGVLGLYSLPYCYAGANGARVLIESKKITEQSGKRLAETAEFVFEVCHKDAFAPDQKGFLSILNVRVMHAAARYYTIGKINDEVPVNQDDQLATLLAFSLITLRGLRKLGIDVNQQESVDYLYLWNVIGEKLGLDQCNLPGDVRQASVLDRDMRRREFKQSPQGQLLTRSLIDYIDQENKQSRLVKGEDLLYYFLGDHAAILGINQSAGYSSSLIRGVFNTQKVLGDLNGTNFKMIRRDLKKQLKALDTELRF